MTGDIPDYSVSVPFQDEEKLHAVLGMSKPCSGYISALFTIGRAEKAIKHAQRAIPDGKSIQRIPMHWCRGGINKTDVLIYVQRYAVDSPTLCFAPLYGRTGRAFVGKVSDWVRANCSKEWIGNHVELWDLVNNCGTW